MAHPTEGDRLSRVFGAGWDGDESVGRIPLDSPPVVVDEHVMVSAEQDAVVDVGAPAFGDRNDVVTLTPGNRPVASGETAPSVAGGEVLRFAPALIASNANIDEAISILDRVLCNA